MNNIDYIPFSSRDERDKFLKKYKLLSQNPRKEKNFYYKGRDVSSPTLCEILGYQREYSDSATLVIDYGNGPLCILSDLLKQMQNSKFSLDEM